MKKEKEVLDTENKLLSSLLEKQKKRTGQLEAENKELLSQIEKEKKTSQEVSGNLYILYFINLYPSCTSLLTHNMNRKEWIDEDAKENTREREDTLWFEETDESNKTTWNREKTNAVSDTGRKENITWSFRYLVIK